MFGLTIGRAPAPPITGEVIPPEEKSIQSVGDGRGGWLPLIRESFAGAWQSQIKIDESAVHAFHAVFACITLIASDIRKLRVKLVQRSADGIWLEVRNPAYTPVLRKPTPWQTRNQFWECWILSKLLRGNTYVLKVRDNRNVVVAMYVLDPNRTRPMVADDGSVFYELSPDRLSKITESVLVPAREIIHDRANCLFHPLVGVSPIYANGLAATQGLEIQRSSTRLFRNNSRPGGLLTAPGRIDDPTAERLKTHWEDNFSGENLGRVAVLGNGLKFENLTMTADDAQLIDQLKWSGEVVCSTFHVPPYKVGIGAMPAYNNIQALNVEYYSQCLQSLIEDAETCLDEGLGIGDMGPDAAGNLGTEFDIDGLLRMDSVTQMEVLKVGVAAGILEIDEARAKLDRRPTPGGNAAYLQQQNYSLAALAKRDAGSDPFGKQAAPAATPAPAATNDNAAAAAQANAAMVEIYKGLG